MCLFFSKIFHYCYERTNKINPSRPDLFSTSSTFFDSDPPCSELTLPLLGHDSLAIYNYDTLTISQPNINFFKLNSKTKLPSGTIQEGDNNGKNPFKNSLTSVSFKAL